MTVRVALGDARVGSVTPRAVRRWVVSPPDIDAAEPDGLAEPGSFSRKAIALRALRGAAPGTQLIDSLTGEVVTEVDPAPG